MSRNDRAMIQGKEPVVLQSMGTEWMYRAHMITTLLAEALPWIDDNILGYIAEFAVQKEYISRRARVYWSYMRPMRPPGAGTYRVPPDKGYEGLYNPPIRGPVERARQIVGLTQDSHFAQFRSPVRWLTGWMEINVLFIQGSLNRFAYLETGRRYAGQEGVRGLLVGSRMVSKFHGSDSNDHRNYYAGGTINRLGVFDGRDEEYWSKRPYVQNAKHPYPPKRWWGPGTPFAPSDKWRPS